MGERAESPETQLIRNSVMVSDSAYADFSVRDNRGQDRRRPNFQSMEDSDNIFRGPFNPDALLKNKNNSINYEYSEEEEDEDEFVY